MIHLLFYLTIFVNMGHPGEGEMGKYGIIYKFYLKPCEISLGLVIERSCKVMFDPVMVLLSLHRFVESYKGVMGTVGFLRIR